MNKEYLALLLEKFDRKELDSKQIMAELENLPYKDLEYARVDHHRAVRQGLPEVIFCPGKTADQVVGIANELCSVNPVVVATKATDEMAAQVLKIDPGATFWRIAGIISWGKFAPPPPGAGKVSVITAGTADLPIAEEAATYLLAASTPVERINDVGIAGVHRLLDQLPLLRTCAVHLVIAGMDGALPGLVAGLVAEPVIAVPTSTGYGASFGGLAALLTMLNSCSAGLTVVNIDNGFGGATAALRVLSMLKRQRLAGNGKEA